MFSKNHSYFSGFRLRASGLMLGLFLSAPVAAQDASAPAVVDPEEAEPAVVDPEEAEPAVVDPEDLLREETSQLLSEELSKLKKIRIRRNNLQAGVLIPTGMLAAPILIGAVPFYSGVRLLILRDEFESEMDQEISDYQSLVRDVDENSLTKHAERGVRRRVIQGSVMGGASSIYYAVSVVSDDAVHLTVSGALIMASVGRALYPSYEERIQNRFEKNRPK